MNVTLTDAELAQSFTVAGDDQFHDNVFDREAVESIVAARVAIAWDEGHQVHAGCRECWDDGHGDQINPYREA